MGFPVTGQRGIDPMKTRETVARRLLQLCDQRQISPNQLARISGVPPSTMKNILYGASWNPGIVTIKMLCDGLEISLPDFFDWEGFYQLEQELE